ncbi:hypothetical protein P389DRAFT_66913 [Cystobasidium minutum MCA 4210]|uniref:uncharacterized protein n=1 Tax=Cystobasidium minutum MCA 4210 TaxID=1397322 RepID=UPI0034CDD444|eukprot:jgi/Rhomi1/66913/CE66912_200
MPLEANLFYGGVPASPSSSRGSGGRTKRLSSAMAAADTDVSNTTTAVSRSSIPVASTSRAVHTPSPSRTSRIPPPPTSPTPRRSAGAGGTAARGSRRRPAASKVSPDKFKLHFQGRVYRPFSATSPPSARKLYSPSQGLLGQPDELVDDADAIIDCPCTRNVDDSSLMIQCEECDIWLHANCVGIQYEEDCPEEYYCRKCAPRKVGQMEEQSRPSRQSTPVQEHARSKDHASTSSLRAGSVSSDSSEEDGGLEVEIPAPLASSPINRTPTRTPSKRTAASPSQYSISRNLLSEFANASPILKASPSHPLLTPSKRSKATDKDDTLGTSSTTPRKRARKQVDDRSALDASSVPLPQHYTALLNLHAAVERALLLHLATEGSRACSAAVAAPDSGSSASDNLVVDLPNLATFTGIRAVVERGANKRFGPTELAQLVWLWEGALNGPQASEDVFSSSRSSKNKDGRRGGLSMTVAPARELDRNTGKRVHTWGIGIHLELKQNVQLPALEVVGSSPSPSKQAQELSTPPNLKRVGMSVLPLWSSKAEDRREELRRRLGECVIKAHEDFSSGSALGSAVSKKPTPGTTDDGIILPPTPPASHSKKGASAISQGPFVKGFILDALPPIPAATLPPLGPSSTASLSAPALSTSNGIANADVADIAKEEKTATLPSTRDTSSRPAKALTEERRQLLLNGSKEQKQKAPAEQRAMSLLDRIKAKEAAQAAARDAQNHGAGSSDLATGRKVFTNTKESVARTSLEAASMRAKMRAVRNGL